METNSAPIPFPGRTLRTTARARTSPPGTSNSRLMTLPAGSGLAVEMNSPPRLKLRTRETPRWPPDRQATSIPRGKSIRGWRRLSAVTRAELTNAAYPSRARFGNCRLSATVAEPEPKPFCLGNSANRFYCQFTGCCTLIITSRRHRVSSGVSGFPIRRWYYASR